MSDLRTPPPVLWNARPGRWRFFTKPHPSSYYTTASIKTRTLQASATSQQPKRSSITSYYSLRVQTPVPLVCLLNTVPRPSAQQLDPRDRPAGRRAPPWWTGAHARVPCHRQRSPCRGRRQRQAEFNFTSGFRLEHAFRHIMHAHYCSNVSLRGFRLSELARAA
jgi:hypothetical protein